MGFDPKAFGRLMRQPRLSVTDCPNFIKYRSFDTYKWYSRATLPLLAITRGGPHFSGTTKEVLFGDFDFDSWMVVRYPSHQAMLKMVTNPYYVAVCNPIRMRAVTNFELAFTEPRDPKSGLNNCPLVLALHAAPRSAGEFISMVSQLASDEGLRVVYAAESRYDFDFITRPRPVDPSPLTFPVTVAVSGATETKLRDFARDPKVVAVLRAQPLASAVLYERASLTSYVSFGTSA